MNIFFTVLVIGLLCCLYQLHRMRSALLMERQQRQRISRTAYEAITDLRDVIHGLGWSSNLSSDFSKYQAHISAANFIGESTFNMMARDPGFLNCEDMFSPEIDRESYGNRLAEIDLGELNGKRDELLKKPSLLAAMSLMGSLMHEVMEGVNRQLHARASI